MKKILLSCLAIILLNGMGFSQNLIRVNNNPDFDADYTSLQDAQDNASNGDTIYMEGSVTNYAGADISKSITIIGPGFFLSENPTTQANGLEAKFSDDIYFNTGSDGSIITGCNLVNDYIWINVDDITVTRCKADNIYFNSTSDNILVIQNYVRYIIGVYSSGIITNSVISNNIVGYYISCESTSGPLQITNNVIIGVNTSAINCYNSSIANNICCYSSGQIPVNTGNTISNNILAADGTNANANQYNIVMANVFEDYDGSGDFSTDGKWQLKTGSPAIGAGVGGVDCGAFGGTIPYVLSGIPNLPHIYEATIPGTAISSDGLSGTIKIKSGN